MCEKNVKTYTSQHCLRKRKKRDTWKEYFGKEVNLVYMVTDSFLLDFKNVDVYKEMQNGALKEHMDFSKFPTNHFLYSEEN